MSLISLVSRSSKYKFLNIEEKKYEHSHKAVVSLVKIIRREATDFKIFVIIMIFIARCLTGDIECHKTLCSSEMIY